MAYEALDSLQKTLNRILKQSHHPDINREIISIHDEAVALQLHLQYNPENLEVQERMRETANTTEEIIEYLFSVDNPLYGGWMQPTVEHSNQLMEAAQKFKSTAGDAIHSVSRLSDISPSVGSTSRAATTSKDVVVGLDEDVEEIKNRLKGWGRPSKLQVLSIVGTGGIGKTTLAKLIYNDESIMNTFRIRAWVTISQDYSLESIHFNLLDSLKGGMSFKGDGKGISKENLIRTYLEGGRFLIVIDDMCSKKAWDDLKMLFPDTDSSSRIMLTTRLYDVAAYVDSSSPVHTMRLLNAHHSWDLLKKKVFVDESCPIELEDVARKILKNCGGLPLSIVVVVGILSKVPKTRDSWKSFSTNHGHLETIISLSYNLLPDHMRACFLYMGGFPEDYEIRVSQLIKLWIAEGFFLTGSIIVEEEAVEVLENLAERSLVLVGRRKYDGKIKSCSLHDIVREFCIRQAKQEKFLLSVRDYLPSPILRRHFLPRVLKNYGRISAASHDLDIKDSTYCSLTHSIICTQQRGYKCISSMHKFSSLKVFHVIRRNDNWEWEPSQVLDLVYLIYLASNIPTNIVPPAISTLQNLQTLIIYRSDVVLPMEIWMLRQLRHLVALSFNSLPHPRRAHIPLENLQTMSLVMGFVCSARMVEMIPNIKKLGISSYMDMVDSSYQLYNLIHLRQLDKLKLEGLSVGVSLKLFSDPLFPPTLKKLTLCDLGLPWECMMVIGSLPNLQVLKLRNYACFGVYWLTKKGEFGELRHLLIDGSHLKYWITSGNNFPRLECLTLLRCADLNTIPSNIGKVPTLNAIEVDSTRRLFFSSVKLIEEKQKKSGNDSFEVRVKHS